MNKLGYCCINLSLGKDVKTNRTKRGLNKLSKPELLKFAGELAYRNIMDLDRINAWNVQQGISLYRLSSDVFPFWDQYELTELPNYETIAGLLSHIGAQAKLNGVRLTYHPGPYDTLSTSRTDVADKAVKSINNHSVVFDLMGLDRSHAYPINVHVYNFKPSKEVCTDNFIRNFDRLSDSAKARLVVENDDSPNAYSPSDLKQYITDRIGCPITFDFYHYKLGKQEGSERDSLDLCLSTWGQVQPLTHYSSSRRQEFNDPKIRATAHADYILEEIPTYGLNFDCELEAKAKDLALLKYRTTYS